MELLSSWEQLSAEQVLAIAPILLQKPSIANQIAVLEALLTPEQAFVYAQFMPEQVSKMLHQAKVWWSKPLKKPIIPTFSMGDMQYLLPDECFYHCCFVEFIHAETVYQRLSSSESGVDRLVDQLILTLCRPKRQDIAIESPEWDGDYRERFNPELIASRIDKANFSMSFRAYFMLFYAGCMQFVHDRYPSIFKKGSGKAGFGWTGVVYDIADKGTFGTALEVKYSPLYNVLTYLDKCQYDFIQWKNSQKN